MTDLLLLGYGTQVKNIEPAFDTRSSAGLLGRLEHGPVPGSNVPLEGGQ